MRALLSAIVMATFLSIVPHAFADTNCPVSPSDQSCTVGGLTIQTGMTNSTTVRPGDTLGFTITITNTGPTPATNATITDIFPQFINFVSGPGNIDPNSRQVTFPLGTLLPGASRTFTLTGTVNGTQLETNQPTCVANIAYVTLNNASAQDSTQLCIHPSTTPLIAQVPATQTPASQSAIASPAAIPLQSPATGANDWEWILIVGFGMSGYAFRKIRIPKSEIRNNTK